MIFSSSSRADSGAPVVEPMSVNLYKRTSEFQGRRPHPSLGFFKEQRELAAFYLRACEIRRQPLVKMRVADEELLGSLIGPHKLGDLLHFGDPAIRLAEHRGNLAFEPS